MVFYLLGGGDGETQAVGFTDLVQVSVGMLFSTEQWLPYPLEVVFRFFADPRNLPRISPPTSGATFLEMVLVPPPGGEGLAGAGSELTISFRMVPFLPLRSTWKVRIVEFAWNDHFRDLQVEGPFRRWDHRHEFSPAAHGGRAGTVLRDTVHYEVGFGSAIGDPLFVRPMLRRMFAYRHEAAQRLLGGG